MLAHFISYIWLRPLKRKTRFPSWSKIYFPNRVSILVHFYFFTFEVLNLQSNGKRVSFNVEPCLITSISYIKHASFPRRFLRICTQEKVNFSNWPIRNAGRFRHPQQRKYFRLHAHSVLFCWFRTPQFELKVWLRPSGSSPNGSTHALFRPVDGPRPNGSSPNGSTQVLFRPVN